jgi:hypothetical protein
VCCCSGEQDNARPISRNPAQPDSNEFKLVVTNEGNDGKTGAVMSALPPKADIAERDHDVRFVPKADIDLFQSALK